MTRFYLSLGMALAMVTIGRAEVKTKTIHYQHDGVPLKGYLAWEDSVQGKRPGVLVVHEWWGLNDHARKRAEMLAKLGYVAFCPDMYGRGQVVEHPKEAASLAGQVRNNQETWRQRALKGLEVLKSQPMCDAQQLAAIGFCFGGSTTLQLAFAGADLDAVVSFHGGLMVPNLEEAKAVKPRLLICHGSIDPFIQEETIQGLLDILEKGGVDYQFIAYAGAKHSFTVPNAEKSGLNGVAYNRKADQRSWQHMQMLFNEVFKTQSK